MSKNRELYLRNVIFGMIDSLVSTVGLLAGIDITGTSRQTIIATGIIYALVEGFSMAVGSFLSEESVEEYEVKREVSLNNSASGAIVMFASFVIASFIPLAPYVYLSLGSALWFSIIVSIILLFVVGAVSAKLSKVSVWSRATQMAFLGATAIIIGVVVGKFFKVG